MAISNAVERGGMVYIYDENNRQAGTVPAGNEPDDGLKGYTASRVNVQRGGMIYSHDERGHVVGMTPTR